MQSSATDKQGTERREMREGERELVAEQPVSVLPDTGTVFMLDMCMWVLDSFRTSS